MKTEFHPVTLQLQPLFDNTSLDSGAVKLCKQAVDDYFKAKIFYQSEDFIEALNTLYALNDKKTYSILQIETSSGYTYFLMPTEQGLRHNIFQAGSHYLKQSGNYEGQVLGEEHKKIVALAESILVAVAKTLTYMKRSATGIKEEVEIDYPSVEELTLFYECKRKIAYDSLTAAMAALWDENDVYLCRHCGMYHQGKSPSENKEEIDDNTRLKRFQRVWRYSHNLGEFRHRAGTVSYHLDKDT